MTLPFPHSRFLRSGFLAKGASAGALHVRAESVRTHCVCECEKDPAGELREGYGCTGRGKHMRGARLPPHAQRHRNKMREGPAPNTRIARLSLRYAPGNRPAPRGACFMHL